MNQKDFSNIILVVIIIILVGSVGYFAFVKKSAPVVQLTATSTATQSSKSSMSPISSQTQITILVPDNATAYDKAMTTYAQEGGQDPSKTWLFVKKTLNIPYTTDIIRASADAAAEQLTPYGGPAKASIAYLKIRNDTAYVLLDIDLDGWTGVSVSLSRIHPLVEKTLLQFSQIKHVVFGFAPRRIREEPL